MQIVSNSFSDLKAYRKERKNVINKIRDYFNYPNFRLQPYFWVLQIQGDNGLWLNYETANDYSINDIFKTHKNDKFRILTHDLRKRDNNEK